MTVAAYSFCFTFFIEIDTFFLYINKYASVYLTENAKRVHPVYGGNAVVTHPYTCSA